MARPIVCAVMVAVGAALLDDARIVARVSDSRAPAPIWRAEAETRGVPAASGSRVFVLTKRRQLIALDGASGARLWTARTGDADAETYGTTVITAGELVVAGDYDVLAFHAATGARAWTFTPADGYGPGIYLGAVADGVVYAGSPAGRVYGIDVATGSCRWSSAPIANSRITMFTPIVSGDLVVAGYSAFDTPRGGGVVAIDRSSGRTRWTYAFGTADRPVVYGGGLAATGSSVIASDNGGNIHVLDAASGMRRATFEALAGRPDAAGGSDLRPLAAEGRMLYAGSLSGTVTAFDLDARKVLWKYAHATAGSTGVRIVSDGDTVYVPHLSGLVVALDAASGRERWILGEPGAGFLWAPLVKGNRIYVGSSKAGAFALPR